MPRVDIPTMVVLVVVVAADCGGSQQPGAGTSQEPRAAAASRCAVTMPNGDTPRGERQGGGHHGDGALWTILPGDGRVVGVDEVVLSDHAALVRVVGDGIFGLARGDGSVRAKFPWWWADRASSLS